MDLNETEAKEAYLLGWLSAICEKLMRMEMVYGPLQIRDALVARGYMRKAAPASGHGFVGFVAYGTDECYVVIRPGGDKATEFEILMGLHSEPVRYDWEGSGAFLIDQ